MLTDPTLTLADQLFWIVDCFCKTMAPEACKRRIGAISGSIWNRVRYFERRFYALYAPWKAGILPEGRAAAARTPHPNPPRRVPLRSAQWGPDQGGRERKSAGLAGLLPRGVGWLQKLLPMGAGTLAGGLESLLLNCPEMRAFVAAVPQVGRVLRPWCKMVGLKAPEWLALPRRVRRSDPPPRPSPSRGEGESDDAAVRPRRRRTAREVAAAAMAKARRTGKPVDPKKIGSVAYGYVLHWPRDEHCPPPEIGYAPMRVRVPRDYGGFWRKRE